MNKKLKHSIFITIFGIIGISLLVWVFKQISLQEIIDVFINSNHWFALLFVIASFAILSLHSMRWKLIVKTTGHNIPFWKIIQYKIAGMGVSFLTPGAKVGGEPIRAMLLKKHDVEFHKGLSTVITDKIVDLSVQGVLFIVASVVAITTVTMPKDMYYILILVTVFFAVLISYVYYQIFNDRNLFVKLFKLFRLNKIKSFQNAEHKIVEFERLIVKFHKEDTKEFYLSVALTIGSWGIMFIEYWAAMMMMGVVQVSFIQLFMIITMMGAAYLMPIPMALGVFEAGEITVFKMFGLSAAAGVGLAMVIRTRDIIYSMIAFPILVANGMTWKKLKNKEKL